MKLNELRNLAFVAMTFGGVCLGAVDSRAAGTCRTCTSPGSGGECMDVAQGNPGWTGCTDGGPNCSISGSQCFGS